MAGRVIGVGGGDTVLIRLAQAPAAHPCGGGETPVAARGFGDTLLLVILVCRGIQQQPLRAVPNTLLLKDNGIIGGKEAFALATLGGYKLAVHLGDGRVNLHCAVLRGGGVFMPSLHTVNTLRELGFTRSVGVGGVGVGLLNAHLLLIATACGDGGGDALHLCRVLIHMCGGAEQDLRAVGIHIKLCHRGGTVIEESPVGVSGTGDGFHAVGLGGCYLRHAALSVVRVKRVMPVMSETAGEAELLVIEELLRLLKL